MARKAEALALLAAIALLGAAACAFSLCAGRESTLGGYATSLRGRSPAQKHNAQLAARRLNGTAIPAGGTISFNRIVGSWTADRGYLRAPVSYDGELLPAWGGGVCQTSTTLYNAALLAGLEIKERHRHEYVPHYVAPGRDAAVAYPAIDLVLRNPYPWPVHLIVEAEHDVLQVSVIGPHRPADTVSIVEEAHSVIPAPAVVQVSASDSRRCGVANPGQAGREVVIYRVRRRDGRPSRYELVSADYYPPISRVVRVSQER